MIEANTISLFLNGKTILHDITFSLKQGERLALIGHSGAGKSMLVKLLMGLSGGYMQGKLSIGDVSIQSGWVEENTSYTLRGSVISMLPQSLADSLNPQLTVLEHVIESLHIHSKKPKQHHLSHAKQALIQGNVPHYLHNRYPRRLSGGETQRVLFVLALLHKPSLLILDEPTSALDNSAHKYLYEQLLHLPKNISIIFITHDLKLVQDLAHKVMVIDRGTVIEYGNTQEMTPTQPSTIALVKQHTKSAPPTPHTYSNQPILDIEKLGYQVEQRVLFKHLNLKLHAGEVVIIHGKSGAGKTTLSKLITQRLPLQTGTIRHIKSNQPIGIISQYPFAACAPHFSIERIITEPLQLMKKASSKNLRAKAQALLKKVSLPTHYSFLKKRPHELSGGELQRVIIARALALTPTVLIADEPTSALDPLVRQSMLELLNNIRKQYGIGIIIFTHDFEISHYFKTSPLILTPQGLSTTGCTSCNKQP